MPTALNTWVTPTREDPPLKGLDSPSYAGIAGRRPSTPTCARPAKEIKPGQPQPYESDQTTHYRWWDKAGNAVAVTYTLEQSNFGSGIVAKRTGILLNNEMDDFCRCQARRG